MATITGGSAGEVIEADGRSVNDGGFDGLDIFFEAGIEDANVTLEGDGSFVFVTPGDDTITIGGNDVILEALDGDDLVILAGEDTAPVTGATIDLGGGDNQIGGSNIDNSEISGAGTVAGLIEDINNSTLDFTGAEEVELTATGDNNEVRLGDGSNAVTAVGDGNVVLGSTGNDTLAAQGDGGLVGGAAGDKAVAVDGQGNLGATGTGNDDIALIGGFNKAYGGDGNDTIIGSSAGNNDTLSGDAGNDWLEAGVNSRLYGGDGDDTLVGADGSKLYGGAGDDLYLLMANFGSETIFGFEAGEQVHVEAGAFAWAGHADIAITDNASLLALVNTPGSGVSISGSNSANIGVKLTIGDSVINIKGITAADFNAGNFFNIIKVV